MQSGIFKYMQPEQHCTEVYAVDNLGGEVDPCHSDAVAWCAQGWSFLQTGEYYDIAVFDVAQRLGYDSVGDANDDLGWRFIEALQAAGI